MPSLRLPRLPRWSRAASMKNERREVSLEGLGVSPGIAIGPVFFSQHDNIAVPEYRLEADALQNEIDRFAAAVARSVKQLRKLKQKTAPLPDTASEELGYLLDAHLHMLTQSRLIRGVERRIAAEAINAERAVQLEIAEIGESFAAMGDPYLAARIEDIRVVGARLLRNLTKTPYVAFQGLAPSTVILAEELSPADTALMDPRQISGFATALGGAESHTAIMARALALPAVLGVAGLLGAIRGEAQAVIDGSAGLVILD